MNEDKLILISCNTAKNRNTIIQTLEDNTSQRLVFLHSLKDKNHSENIIFKISSRSNKLFKQICQLREKNICTFDTITLKKSVETDTWSSTDKIKQMTSTIADVPMSVWLEISHKLESLIQLVSTSS